jgi:hypothetical protein
LKTPLAFGALIAALVWPSPASAAALPEEVTVFIDLIVEDAKGRPALNLRPEEVVVVQDGAQQRVTSVTSGQSAGRYELRYVPTSGKGGAVKLQVLRQGARVRGPDGPSLKPRVFMPFSPIETAMAALLDQRPDAADFLARTEVMRFESTPEGLHHTFAVEIPFTGLGAKKDATGFSGRVQIFARLSDATGRVVQRSFVDRAISAASELELLTQRLVWTGRAHLPPGLYTLETLVVDETTSKASARKIAFQSPEVAPGLRVSSVALVLPMGGLVLRDKGGEQDDPFLVNGTPVMPTLALETVAAPGAKVEFFTIVYPDTSNTEPVKLRVDLMRDGDVVGSGPIALPPPDERGEIRYAGGLPTRTMKPAAYKLRLVAQQGLAASVEEVPFTITSGEEAPAQLRFSPSSP